MCVICVTVESGGSKYRSENNPESFCIIWSSLEWVFCCFQGKIFEFFEFFKEFKEFTVLAGNTVKRIRGTFYSAYFKITSTPADSPMFSSCPARPWAVLPAISLNSLNYSKNSKKLAVPFICELGNIAG